MNAVVPETYRESTFEGELRELLSLAQRVAFAECDASACGTKFDYDKARTLRYRLEEHHECFLARWERLAREAVRAL